MELRGAARRIRVCLSCLQEREPTEQCAASHAGVEQVTPPGYRFRRLLLGKPCKTSRKEEHAMKSAEKKKHAAGPSTNCLPPSAAGSVGQCRTRPSVRSRASIVTTPLRTGSPVWRRWRKEEASEKGRLRVGYAMHVSSHSFTVIDGWADRVVFSGGRRLRVHRGRLLAVESFQCSDDFFGREFAATLPLTQVPVSDDVVDRKNSQRYAVLVHNG